MSILLIKEYEHCVNQRNRSVRKPDESTNFQLTQFEPLKLIC